MYAFIGSTFGRTPAPRLPNQYKLHSSSYMTDLPGLYVYNRGSEREGGNKWRYITAILAVTIFPIIPAIRVWTDHDRPASVGARCLSQIKGHSYAFISEYMRSAVRVQLT